LVSVFDSIFKIGGKLTLLSEQTNIIMSLRWNICSGLVDFSIQPSVKHASVGEIAKIKS